MKPIRLEFTTHDGIDRLIVSGPVDTRTIRGFEGLIAALSEMGDDDVVVDLRAVETFYSSAVGMLVSLAARRRGRNAKVNLILSTQGTIIGMLQLARLDSLFEIQLVDK